MKRRTSATFAVSLRVTTIAFPLILILSSILGCIQIPKSRFPGFSIPKKEFMNEVKVVACSPLVVHPSFEDPESARKIFEPLIEAKLKDLGFQIIPAHKYGAIWDAIKAASVGFFDPKTGKEDTKKLTAARIEAFKKLQSQYPEVNALVVPSLIVTTISFNKHYVAWDGVARSLEGDEISDPLGNPDENYRGALPVLSLVVGLMRMNNKTIYLEGGGIEMMAKREWNSLVDVPRKELLKHDNWNAKAVDIAFELFKDKKAQK